MTNEEMTDEEMTDEEIYKKRFETLENKLIQQNFDYDKFHSLFYQFLVNVVSDNYYPMKFKIKNVMKVDVMLKCF